MVAGADHVGHVRRDGLHLGQELVPHLLVLGVPADGDGAAVVGVCAAAVRSAPCARCGIGAGSAQLMSPMWVMRLNWSRLAIRRLMFSSLPVSPMSPKTATVIGSLCPAGAVVNENTSLCGLDTLPALYLRREIERPTE